MENEDIYIDSLIIKYIEKNMSDAEEVELADWVKKSVENKNYFIQFQKLHSITSQSVDVDFDTNSALLKCMRHAEITQKKSRRLYYAFSAIAAVFLLFVGISIFHNNSNNNNFANKFERFATTDSLLNISLKDASKVTLNENTSLKVFTFSDSLRRVELCGNAYFEVEPNTNKAFVVEVGFVNVRVLGTSFDIRQNLADSSITISVTEGRVLVSDTIYNQKYILTANQSCTLWMNKPGITKEKQNQNYLAWKTGMLEFRNITLHEVAHDLGLYYKKHFVLSSPQLGDCKINARFHNTDFDDMLSILSVALSGSVVDNDSVVTISAPECN